MFQIGADWNPKQARLKEIVQKPDRFSEAIDLCLSLHSIVHCSNISPENTATFQDEIWEGLTKKAFVTMPTIRDVTIAWNIWHITRIEDITSNILIHETEQVLDDKWLKRLNTNIRDSGNAMTDTEIMALSGSLDMGELRNYRNAVGIKTRDMLEKLSLFDMKRKIKPESLRKVLDVGGVTEHEDSIWLLDFWGRKTVAGILLMPITRHQIVHLNDCMKLKKKIMK